MRGKYSINSISRAIIDSHKNYTFGNATMNLYREAFTHIKSFSSHFWLVILASFLNQAGNMAFVFLVLYVNKHLGFSLAQASSSFAAFAASMVLTGLLGGSIIDKIGAARVLTFALFMNGIVLLTFPLVTSYYTLIIMCLMWGCSYGLYRPSSSTFISHMSTPGMHKVTFSLYRLALNLGMSIGPAVGGYLASHSFPAIFIANGSCESLRSIDITAGIKKVRLV